jgi:SAM-dependent methyltransferase
LVELCSLTTDSRLLDWGCGPGRLAVGVRLELGSVRDYHGVDVDERVIRWARRNLAAPDMRFTLVDATNARYNPDGTAEAYIPGEPGTVDVFYAYSVLSHMLTDDVRAYARIIAELLAPGGRAFVTLFVEEDVPPCVENPEGYGPMSWTGRLHCVRFARDFFESILAESGLSVVTFEHGKETDGQSLYILGRSADQR